MGTLFRWVTYGAMIIMASGCASTIQQVQEAELATLHMSKAESERVLSGLRDGSIPPDFDVQISLQMDVVNRALAAIDQSKFFLPNDPSIEITLGKIRISTLGALPTVSLEAKASKGTLSAEIDVNAVLAPKEGGAPGEMLIKVLSFVPKIQWLSFEVTKAEFVRTLLVAEVNKIADKMPSVRLPVEEAITFGSIGKTETIRVKTSDKPSWLTMSVSYPSTERKSKLKIQRYVFLKSEVHIFGALE